jgi:transcriptional regulator with XRE-family HTH domain
MPEPYRLRHNRAPEVPPDFWRTDAMVDALSSGDLGRVVRAYRFHPFHGRHLPQSLVAGWMHVSQTSLSRIEQGKCRLTIDDINWFAAILGLSVALRWTPQLGAKEDVDPLSRRSLLGAGAGAALGFSATTAPTAAREIDPELVDHWVKLLRLLDLHDAMRGPYDALAAVRHEINLIAESRQIALGDLRRQLMRVEARWAQFASWLSNDAGQVHSRNAWADRALRLAQEADYPEMAAYVLMRQSRWAADDHDAPRALRLAEAAQGTRRTTEHVRALCALRKAHAHALGHDDVACERSLADAYELLDRADAPQSPWDVLATGEVGAAYVSADEARCWLLLSPNKAIAMLEDALRAWPHDRARSRGVQHARLALACTAIDEPERAAIEGVKALEISRTTRSDMTMRELKRLDHQLAAYDVPAAADFREALVAL